ncbi:hypothetical protein TEA_007569 [Camellia sinensis var. sinensis]|uniref:Isopenicillin N synthase-like Fe(2+) 2OG dioxygenase domain-containing protein n=1 Tax=Camellia sinensis var. sinensis TaxID=542762 RepID=A0A4S4D6J4_CAMSN|nr:hypothetical protein TEA_007569 [Camellia sinensis var. sinensis]
MYQSLPLGLGFKKTYLVGSLLGRSSVTVVTLLRLHQRGWTSASSSFFVFVLSSVVDLLSLSSSSSSQSSARHSSFSSSLALCRRRRLYRLLSIRPAPPDVRHRLTRGMFMRDAVELPCPDSAAGLYIKTRNDQIVKVYFLVVFGEDEIAYQIGETTEILSRGHLCATPHCVRAPKGEEASGIERSTFALFMQPDCDFSNIASLVRISVVKYDVETWKE